MTSLSSDRGKVVECGLSSQKGLQKVREMRFFSFVWLFVTSMARKKCHHLSSFLLLDFWSGEVLAEKPSRPFHSSAASFKSVTENDSLFACAVDALNECDYPSFCRFGALLCGLKGKGLFSWQPFLHKDHSPKRLTEVIDEFLLKWDVLCKFLMSPNTYFLKISTICACSYRAFWVGSPLTDGLFCQRIWQPLKTFPLQRPMEYLFSMPALTEPLQCQFFQSQKMVYIYDKIGFKCHRLKNWELKCENLLTCFHYLWYQRSKKS